MTLCKYMCVLRALGLLKHDVFAYSEYKHGSVLRSVSIPIARTHYLFEC
jgi:hypothetical protein